MKWFKHYHSLSEKDFSQRLIRKHGLEMYARYLILLETCSALYEDRIDGKYVLSKLQLCRKLFAKQSQLTSHVLAMSLEMDFKFEETEFDFVLDIPILAELKHKDAVSYKKRRATGGPATLPQAGELPCLDLEKDLDIDISTVQEQNVPATGAVSLLAGDADREKLLRDIRQDTQLRWLKLYDLELVKREMIKMVNYLTLNPKKDKRTPRGKSQFISTWLSKAYDQQAINTPAVRPHGTVTPISDASRKPYNSFKGVSSV